MPGEVVKIGMIIDSTGMVDGDTIDGQIQLYEEAGVCSGYMS